MYTLLLVLIYLAFISLGLPDSLLGSAWPAMRQVFDVPVSYMGIVSMIISGCTILSSLCSDRMTRRCGTRNITVGSVLLTAAALFGFSTASEFWMLGLWAVPYGLGAGAIDAALNNYVALHYSSRHMSWLHCFWGVGTIVSPYVMGYSLVHATWRDGYRLVSFLQMGIALILLLTLPVWRVHQSPAGKEAEGGARGLLDVLRIKGVLFQFLGFFAYSAAEATTMLWASTYLSAVRAVPAEQAASYASRFFIGITLGRFISGFAAERLGDRRMIRLGTGVAFLGILGVLLPVETNTAALAGFIVIGLGCAPVYPAIIHSTPDHFGAENSQSVIGVQMAAAYVGSTFMPPLFGVLAGAAGLRLLPFFLLFFFVLMIVMLELTCRRLAAREILRKS